MKKHLLFIAPYILLASSIKSMEKSSSLLEESIINPQQQLQELDSLHKSFDIKLTKFNSPASKADVNKRLDLLTGMAFLAAEIKKIEPSEKTRINKLRDAYKTLDTASKTKIKEATYGTMVDEMSDSESEKNPYEKVKTAAKKKADNNSKFEALKKTIESLTKSAKSYDEQINEVKKQLKTLEIEQEKIYAEKGQKEEEQQNITKANEYLNIRQSTEYAQCAKQYETASKALKLTEERIKTLEKDYEAAADPQERTKIREQISAERESLIEKNKKVEELSQTKKKMEDRIQGKTTWSDYSSYLWGSK